MRSPFKQTKAVCSSVLIGLVVLASAAASDTKTVEKQIQSVNASLNSNKAKQDKLQKSLKSTETKIGSLTKQLDQTSNEINQQQKKLDTLKKQLAELSKSLSEKQNHLAKQIQASYLLMHQGTLSLYFNTEESQTTDRLLVYYQSIEKAELDAIVQLNQTVTELNSTLALIQTHTNKLKSLYKTQNTQKTEQLSAKKERSTLLANIKKDINNQSKKLSQLHADQTKLSNIVTDLKAKPSTGPLNFSLAKGRLSWPAKGKVRRLFYESMDNSSLKWQGDIIEASAGTRVQAIYSGKIIYSDWLRGYGLLTIIDHGDGYMSLYARNETLYAKVGDVVHTGDVIAKVGQSGGFSTPGLYFEVRHNGTAVNPSGWCK